jgi:hypothetical protein
MLSQCYTTEGKGLQPATAMHLAWHSFLIYFFFFLVYCCIRICTYVMGRDSFVRLGLLFQEEASTCIMNQLSFILNCIIYEYENRNRTLGLRYATLSIKSIVPISLADLLPPIPFASVLSLNTARAFLGMVPEYKISLTTISYAIIL